MGWSRFHHFVHSSAQETASTQVVTAEDEIIVSKCANPECTNTLHYLRSGKVFKIEMEGPVLMSGLKPVLKVEHFWLCGTCSETQTLTYDNAQGVRVLQKTSVIRRGPKEAI